MGLRFKAYIQYFLFWLLAVSCSTPQYEIVIRGPAAEENCASLVQSFIAKNSTPQIKDAPTIEIPEAIPELSLSKILNSRKELNSKYTNIIESIKDFKVDNNGPINGQSKLLLDPHEGYLAKILLIRNAKKTLDLSYFIFTGDDTGKTLLHELRLAIKRGVKVRLLVDSTGSFSKAPFYDDIKALASLNGQEILDEFGSPTGEFAHAEAVLFNPLFNVRAHVANWMKAVHNLFVPENERLPLATFTINRRSHDKILMADANSPKDAMAIIGGRNIADKYYAVNAGVEHPILDAEILIKGFVTKNDDGSINNALEDHYNKIFYYLANKNFEDFLFKTNRDQVRKEFKQMRDSSKRLLHEHGQLNARLQEMVDSKFLENDFEDGLISILNEIQNLSRTKLFMMPKQEHYKANGNSLISKLHADIAKAEDTVDIVSPYFWIPDEEIEFIINWAAKYPHRKVRIFSNSLTTTNNIVAQSMVDATFKETIMKRIQGTPIEKQIEIYSYGKLDDEVLGGNQRYGFLHAKIVVVDGKTLTVSTSNLDPISRHLNSEVGTTIENLPKNSKNAQKLNKYIEDLKNNSTLWGSTEWQEIRKHPKNRIMNLLQVFVTKIIYTLNLVPII
jgi:putative cardiolipin synthase